MAHAAAPRDEVHHRAEACGPDHAETCIVIGGPLSALTPKERDDLGFTLGLGVDWIALSFMQPPEDVEELKRLAVGEAGVMAKLEKPAATPIRGMATSDETARRLAAVWSVHPVRVQDVRDLAEMSACARETTLREGFARGRYHHHRRRNPIRGSRDDGSAEHPARLRRKP